MTPPDSSSDFNRRSFIKTTGLTAGALGAGSILPAFGAKVAPIRPTSETLVKTFYDSLSEEQQSKICFDFDHELRLKVDNNWHITKTLVQDYTADQQEMIRKIFMGLHSEEYAQKVYNHMRHEFDVLSSSITRVSQDTVWRP